ncbi:hypothetical protein Tco_1429792 [Tanacetum coccineum]
MTSFDYRLKPIYAIKECSTCGVLYTADFCCSKKGLEDKILVPKPPRNCARCARCGTSVDGPYCQGCALLRKKFKEDLFTYYVENEFFKDLQDTSESSDDNTNVVNAPQEPFVEGRRKAIAEEQAATLLTIDIGRFPLATGRRRQTLLQSHTVYHIEEPDHSLSMGDPLILREKLVDVNLLIAKTISLRDNPTPHLRSGDQVSSNFPNLFLEETNTFVNSFPES